MESAWDLYSSDNLRLWNMNPMDFLEKYFESMVTSIVSTKSFISIEFDKKKKTLPAEFI